MESIKQGKPFIVLDVEGASNCRPYNIGYIIGDKYGNIYEKRSIAILPCIWENLQNSNAFTKHMTHKNIKEILNRHYESMPSINDNSKEMNIIRRELQKKRNQMPIRKLFSKTGSTVQKIKPVFMMSPISVASFLPPKLMTFDLVVFDEASQVRPVEAFGSLLRARQIVVVGDSKQLPPTTFFDTMTSKYDEMNDEDYDISNMESILTLLLARNIPQRTLSWHYRSRNQSLISFSNKSIVSLKCCIAAKLL